jgi:hypothetical protein
MFKPIFPPGRHAGYNSRMCENHQVDRRNARIWAVIFTTVAIGLLIYGLCDGGWESIVLTSFGAAANFVGAILVSRPSKKAKP